MREIKFRGIDKDSGEFVYGGIAYDVLTASGFIAEVAIIPPRCYGIEVAPNTAGQCTGIRDCYGIDIFEGDILEHDGIGIGHVEYREDNGAYKIVFSGYTRKWFIDMLEREYDVLKVIGNIYENPELLETDK